MSRCNLHYITIHSYPRISSKYDKTIQIYLYNILDNNAWNTFPFGRVYTI